MAKETYYTKGYNCEYKYTIHRKWISCSNSWGDHGTVIVKKYEKRSILGISYWVRLEKRNYPDYFKETEYDYFNQRGIKLDGLKKSQKRKQKLKKLL